MRYPIRKAHGVRITLDAVHPDAELTVNIDGKPSSVVMRQRDTVHSALTRLAESINASTLPTSATVTAGVLENGLQVVSVKGWTVSADAEYEGHPVACMPL